MIVAVGAAPHRADDVRRRRPKRASLQTERGALPPVLVGAAAAPGGTRAMYGARGEAAPGQSANARERI
jgi:hypothetical protein